MKLLKQGKSEEHQDVRYEISKDVTRTMPQLAYMDPEGNGVR